MTEEQSQRETERLQLQAMCNRKCPDKFRVYWVNHNVLKTGFGFYISSKDGRSPLNSLGYDYIHAKESLTLFLNARS